MKSHKVVGIRLDLPTVEYLENLAQSQDRTVTDVMKSFIEMSKDTQYTFRKVLEWLLEVEETETLDALNILIETLKEHKESK